MLEGKRVLIVEDEGLVAMTAEMAVEDEGAVVVGPATTLEQGLALARAGGIDAAVLDVNLRGEKSYPIADVLVERGVPFVFATGYDGSGWNGQAPELAKPYNEAALAAALRELLDDTSA